MFNYWSTFTSVYWCWTVLPLFFAILDKFRARLLFVLNISSIFSDVWKEMYVARDIFSLFLLHLCRKLQRRAPFWGQSGRKSFTTKTFPLPYSATAPLFPTSDDLHVQSSRCCFTAVLSTKFAVRRFCKIRSKNFCHFGKNGSYLHPQRERNVSYDSGK